MALVVLYIEDDDKACVVSGKESWCTSFERNASSPDKYRATRLDTAGQVVFSLSEQAASLTATAPAASSGGPAQPSA